MRSDRPARAGRQRAGRGCQRAHVQRVSGGKSAFSLARERGAVDVPEDCSAIGTRLVEQDFHAVRHQRRRDRDQQRMVAGAPQRLDERARSDPTGGGEKTKDLFVGTSGQGGRVSSGAGTVSRAFARGIATSGPIVPTVKAWLRGEGGLLEFSLLYAWLKGFGNVSSFPTRHQPRGSIQIIIRDF
jgi:hypothetical protein